MEEKRKRGSSRSIKLYQKILLLVEIVTKILAYDFKLFSFKYQGFIKMLAKEILRMHKEKC